MILLSTVLFASIVTLISAFPHGGAPCKTGWDCCLGGVCDTNNNTCVCDPWFTGKNCTYLNLAHAEENYGFQVPGYYSWGGHCAYNATMKKYVAFFAFMTNHCTLSTWTTNSEIVMTTADAPHGPFDTINYKTIVPPWSHNPYLVHYTDPNTKVNQWMIWHIGDGSNHTKQQNCTSTSHNNNQEKYSGSTGTFYVEVSTNSLYGPWSEWRNGNSTWKILANTDGIYGGPPAPGKNSSTDIYLGQASTFEECESMVLPIYKQYNFGAFTWESSAAGSWSNVCYGIIGTSYKTNSASYATTGVLQQGSNQIIINETWVTDVSNPAPFIFPNGTVLLYFSTQGCPQDWGLAPACIGMARSTTGWQGPYNVLGSLPIVHPESEDPTVWQDPRGNFHLFTNVNTYHRRCPAKAPCGGHSWSYDGITWGPQFIGAFGPVIHLKNGTTWTNSYTERPQVYQDVNKVPITFFVGMGRTSYTDSISWAQPFCTQELLNSGQCDPTIPL